MSIHRDLIRDDGLFMSGRPWEKDASLKEAADYVRAVSTLIEVWTNCNDAKLECKWAMAATTLPGATTVAPHLGSSDCQCPSHLFHYSQRPEPSDFEALIQAKLNIEHVDEAA